MCLQAHELSDANESYLPKIYVGEIGSNPQADTEGCWEPQTWSVSVLMSFHHLELLFLSKDMHLNDPTPKTPIPGLQDVMARNDAIYRRAKEIDERIEELTRLTANLEKISEEVASLQERSDPDCIPALAGGLREVVYHVYQVNITNSMMRDQPAYSGSYLTGMKSPILTKWWWFIMLRLKGGSSSHAFGN